MFQIRYHRNNLLTAVKSQNIRQFFSTVSLIQNNEYSENPQYPTIEDLSYKGKQRKIQNTWYNKIKKLETVEEKLLEINMPRYYGYKTIMLSEKKTPYNCLPLVQHVTETVFQEIDELPNCYNKYRDVTDSFLKSIQTGIENAIIFEFQEQKRISDSELNVNNSIISHINRVLLNSLLADVSHLNEVEVDLNPRHEAFWFIDGIMPPKKIKNIKAGITNFKEYANDPILRPVQYVGKPIICLRHPKPLEPITNSLDISRNAVPRYSFDPKTLGYDTEHRHGTTIPGFWPGSTYEYPILSYQNSSVISNYNTSQDFMSYKPQMIHSLAIQSSFALLYGISCYNGFSTFNDLTYPLTTQTILTDGQTWSFYVYQLNTNRIGNNEFEGSPNICWGTKQMQLFEKIEDNKIVGLNENVLRLLIQFYQNIPTERNINMKPYLGKTQKISNIEDDKRRAFLERTYKHMVSNRKRHREVYEVYNWEKIYKIDNNTRPLERKSRPFELGVNPFKRRMDEHTPPYIPKILRPGGPKSKPKWEKMYYP